MPSEQVSEVAALGAGLCPRSAASGAVAAPSLAGCRPTRSAVPVVTAGAATTGCAAAGAATGSTALSAAAVRPAEPCSCGAVAAAAAGSAGPRATPSALAAPAGEGARPGCSTATRAAVAESFAGSAASTRAPLLGPAAAAAGGSPGPSAAAPGWLEAPALRSPCSASPALAAALLAAALAGAPAFSRLGVPPVLAALPAGDLGAPPLAPGSTAAAALRTLAAPADALAAAGAAGRSSATRGGSATALRGSATGQLAGTRAGRASALVSILCSRALTSFPPRRPRSPQKRGSSSKKPAWWLPADAPPWPNASRGAQTPVPGSLDPMLGLANPAPGPARARPGGAGGGLGVPGGVPGAGAPALLPRRRAAPAAGRKAGASGAGQKDAAAALGRNAGAVTRRLPPAGAGDLAGAAPWNGATSARSLLATAAGGGSEARRSCACLTAFCASAITSAQSGKHLQRLLTLGRHTSSPSATLSGSNHWCICCHRCSDKAFHARQTVKEPMRGFCFRCNTLASASKAA